MTTTKSGIEMKRKSPPRDTSAPYYNGGSAKDGEWNEFFISQPPNCIAVFPERLGSSKAHRDFVLRAVNSHADLLAIVQRFEWSEFHKGQWCCPECGHTRGGHRLANDATNTHACTIGAAIAKARGQA